MNTTRCADVFAFTFAWAFLLTSDVKQNSYEADKDWYCTCAYHVCIPDCVAACAPALGHFNFSKVLAAQPTTCPHIMQMNAATKCKQAQSNAMSK